MPGRKPKCGITSTLASSASLPYDCVNAPTRGLKPRSQTSAWIRSRSALRCGSIFCALVAADPELLDRSAARSIATHAMTFECVKWRRPPRTSQMPSSGRCQASLEEVDQLLEQRASLPRSRAGPSCAPRRCTTCTSP